MPGFVESFEHPSKSHPDVLRILLPPGESITATYGPSEKKKTGKRKSYFVTAFTTGLLKVTFNGDYKNSETHYLYPGYAYPRPITEDVTITIENIGGCLIGLFKS